RRRVLTPEWATAAWGYVRFHSGRSLPPGCYRDPELAGWAARLAALWPNAAADVFAYFNNDGYGCALRDAGRFARDAAAAGFVPKIDLGTWDFKVYGLVDNPLTLTWDQFRQLPRKTVHTDIHCVTRWSKLDTTWEGVAVQEILTRAQVRSTATHVVSHAEQG